MQPAQLTPGHEFSPMQSLFYYSQRLVTEPTMRRWVAAGLGALVRLRAGPTDLNPIVANRNHESLCELEGTGIAQLGKLFTSQQLDEIHGFLADKVLVEHGPRGRRFSAVQTPEDVSMADYDLTDILNCPHILQLANSPSLLALAAQYIGCKPTVSALGLRWSFPTGAAGEGLQAFHRDLDDWRFLKVFVYLTDVPQDGGPHVYVKGSHLTRAPLRLRAYGKEELKQAYGDEQIISVTGCAGQGFAADTYGIHKGAVPVGRPRLLLQFQYSMLPVYAYRYKPLAIERSGEFDTYVNRLFLK